MSLTSNPNFNDYVERIVEIFNASPLLFPHTVGQDNDVQDLIKQVIPYLIPNPLDPQGPQYPHIVVTTSRNPIIFRQQTGRNSRDEQGPELLELEFYIIIICKDSRGIVESEQQSYDIRSAVTTVLDRKKRLTDTNDENPLCATSTWIDVPYLIESDQKELIARNIIFRPKVYVNLRTS